MIKMCENCGVKPVAYSKYVPRKYCGNVCRLKALQKHNILFPPTPLGPPKKPVCEKHVNLSINLTPTEAAVAARAGGAKGLPQKARQAIREGIRILLQEMWDSDESIREYYGPLLKIKDKETTEKR
jgi:hypothetical protein